MFLQAKFRFVLTSTELEDLQRTVKSVINKTCSLIKNPKFKDIVSISCLYNDRKYSFSTSQYKMTIYGT